jgi:hypothetical protein
MTLQQLLHSGRSSIIQLALNLIQDHLSPEKIVDANHFDRIRVMTNGTGIRVELLNPIKYVPANSTHFYDINVDVMHNSFWYDITSNPPDREHDALKIPFFFPTEETEKHVQFVLNAINKDAGLAKVETKKEFIEQMDGSLVIRDHPEYYQIDRISDYQESWYKIHKITGEIYDDGHAHMEPAIMEEEDEWEEIK